MGALVEDLVGLDWVGYWVRFDCNFVGIWIWLGFGCLRFWVCLSWISCWVGDLVGLEIWLDWRFGLFGLGLSF